MLLSCSTACGCETAAAVAAAVHVACAGTVYSGSGAVLASSPVMWLAWLASNMSVYAHAR
jgi:hypothetical protein